MADAPWFKFYPSDWLAGVRRLSGLERGVYISLIAMMYDHGKPLSDELKELAEDCGVTRRQFDAALAELVRRGKILQTDDGLWNERVSCEILARSERISKAKNAVEVREQKKSLQNQGSETSLDDRSMIGRSSILEPDLELEKKESCPKPASPDPDLFVTEQAQKPKKRAGYPADFVAFWKSYPTDPIMSKAETAKAWAKLEPEERAKAAAAVPAFRKWVAKQGADYRTLHAVRFLTQKRFEGLSVAADGTAEIKIDWQKRIGFARKIQQWDVRNWGPMPHQPGCQAPEGLLEPGDGQGWTEYGTGGGST